MRYAENIGPFFVSKSVNVAFLQFIQTLWQMLSRLFLLTAE